MWGACRWIDLHGALRKDASHSRWIQPDPTMGGLSYARIDREF